MTQDKKIGILVFTSQETLEHKKRDGKYSEERFCFWEMSKFPKIDFNRFYLAVKGQVKGYFKIAIDDIKRDYGEFHFDSDTWTPITDGEILKPSQGFRYYLHDKKNKKETAE